MGDAFPWYQYVLSFSTSTLGTHFGASKLLALLTVITITYMIISPVIVGLSCVAFFLFYQAWKYLFLWQLGQPAWGDTGGLFFPKALTHVFVGIYIQLACLTALFLLGKAYPEGGLAAALIAVTVSLFPFCSLPRSVVHLC
jgi:hypothetical protein